MDSISVTRSVGDIGRYKWEATVTGENSGAMAGVPYSLTRDLLWLSCKPLPLFSVSLEILSHSSPASHIIIESDAYKWSQFPQRHPTFAIIPLRFPGEQPRGIQALIIEAFKRPPIFLLLNDPQSSVQLCLQRHS
jgi:hypothetical protein